MGEYSGAHCSFAKKADGPNNWLKEKLTELAKCLSPKNDHSFTPGCISSMWHPFRFGFLKLGFGSEGVTQVRRSMRRELGKRFSVKGYKALHLIS